MNNPKILYVSGSRIPSLTANSIHVMKMCQAFVQEGYRVELFVPKFKSDTKTPYEKLWKHYGINQPFPISWITSKKNLRCYDYIILATCYALLLKFNLVYTRSISIAAICSNLGLPTIYEAHDLPSGRLGPIYFKLFCMGRGFKCLTVISEALKERLDNNYAYFLKRKKTIITPDGVDLERFNNLPTCIEAKKILGFDPKQFIAGYTGHIYPGRGIDLIISLAKSLRYIQFIIVGGEPKTVSDRIKEVQKQGLSNIKFVGFVNNAELPLYQAASDVLLMPYQRKVSGSSGGNIAEILSPMKMFEYMATGRLIISSNLPVLREVLNDQNSILCDPENLFEWKSALEHAYNNSEFCNKKGIQAQKDVKQYSWKNRVRRILNEINIE